MSSTIDGKRVGGAGNVVVVISRAIGLLALVFAMFAGLFALTGQAPAALIVPSPAGGPESLPKDVLILNWNDHYAVVFSERKDYVRRLYGHGAMLILPYRKSGCFSPRGII